MAHMTVSQVTTICDYLHEWIEEMCDVCGSKDAWVVAPRPTIEQNSIMEALFELKAYAADPSGNSLTDPQIVAICAHLDREKECWSYNLFARLQVIAFIRAIDKHLRDYGEGGINTILRTNDERIGYWFQCAVGADAPNPVFPVDPENVFPPGFTLASGSDDYGMDHGATWNDISTTGMYHWKTLTIGPITGTKTQGPYIDTDLYGKGNLFIQCVAGDTTTTSTFDVTCEKIDGTTTNFPAVGPILNQPAGPPARIDIGVHGTDMFVGVTDMTLAVGGKVNDEFLILSELERYTKIT